MQAGELLSTTQLLQLMESGNNRRATPVAAGKPFPRVAHNSFKLGNLAFAVDTDFKAKGLKNKQPQTNNKNKLTKELKKKVPPKMLYTFKSHSNKFNALMLSHSLFLRSWLFIFFAPSCFEELHKMSEHFLLIIAVPARKLEFTALRIYST